MTRTEFMASLIVSPASQTSAKRHWFHLGEIMPASTWLAVVTFENGNESIRPCATRSEARAYARMQHAYGDVRTTVRRAIPDGYPRRPTTTDQYFDRLERNCRR